MEKQRRFVTGAQLSIRDSQGDEGALVISGRAVGYGCLSVPNVPFSGARERIAPGAFRDSLATGRPVTADYNHSNENLLLATTKNGTLQLDDRADGLHFRINLNSRVQAHRDIHELVRAGTLSECSFAFGNVDDDWSDGFDDEDRSPFQLRTVRKAVLYGISIVNSPAYPDGATSATARSLRSLAYAIGPTPRPGVFTAAELRALRERAVRIGKEIAYQQTLDAVERSKRTGFKEVRIGPNPWDVRFEVMSEAEYDAHLRRKAHRLGEEIHEQLRLEDVKDPSHSYVWDAEEGAYVPRYYRQ